MLEELDVNLSGTWTARALARLTGIPASTVSKWAADGLITTEHYGRGRDGHKIGLVGLIELTAIIELQSAGFSGREIRRAVENLRQFLGEEHPLANVALVVCGNDIAWRDTSELDAVPVSALHAPMQRLMVFPIGIQHQNWLRQLRRASVDDSDNQLPDALTTGDDTNPRMQSRMVTSIVA